jgi:hypothetical protein
MFKPHGLMRAFARGQALALLLIAGAALAEDREPVAILELGVAGEWGFNGSSSIGPAAAVEFIPFRNGLEIETGVQTLFGHGRTEWDTDFVFKRPFDLSPNVEFEPGIGPVWIRTAGSGRTTDAIGAEAVADVMFWPSPDRKFGWFLEPSYTYSFDHGHEQSFGLSAGLLIPIK